MENINAKVIRESQEDIQEVLSLISKLDKKEKELVLATLRGAVLIADSKKED